MSEKAYQKGINAIEPTLLGLLKPEFVEDYNAHQADYKMAHNVSIEEYRSDPGAYRASYGARAPEPVQCERKSIPVTKPRGEIAIEVYTPRKTGPFPCHINFHGGGWVIGGLDDDRTWCSIVCNRVGCVVVNVDYRLAPEFPFPTSNNDAIDVLHWTISNGNLLNIDPERVSIGGLSAGGHLAAITALYAKENGIKLVHQLLTVPVCDARYIPISRDPDALKKIGNPYPSYHELEKAPCLPLCRMQWFADLWLGTDRQERHKNVNSPEASVILHPDLSNVAPATFMIAQVDPLRDEGLAYAQRLKDSGIDVAVNLFKGVPHSFSSMLETLDESKEYVDVTCDRLGRAYGK